MNSSGLIRISTVAMVSMAGLAFGQDAQPPQPLTPPPSLVTPPPPPEPGKPGEVAKVEFKELEHDFGKISDQSEQSHKFEFKNNGAGKLVFAKDFKATCGCTAGKPRSAKNPNVDQFEFAPGEEGYVEVKYNAHGKKGDIQQRVTVLSNDPTQQPEGPVLTIRAKVKPTISFDPPSVGFGDVMAGQNPPPKQIIKVNGAKPDFQIPYVSTSKGRYITARVLDSKTVEVDGEQVGQSTIELTLNTTGLNRGNFAAVGTVRTNDPQYALSDFPVSASIVGDLQVLPPRLNVGVIETGTPFSKTFRVTSRTGKPFKIQKIDQKSQLPSPLEISFTPVEAGKETAYQVNVAGTGLPSQMPINATLVVVTDSPTDPTIEMILSGAVRGAMPTGGQIPAPGATPPVYTPVPTPAPKTDRDGPK